MTHLFCTLDSQRIADLIRSAERFVCYAGPGVQMPPAQAMAEVAGRLMLEEIRRHAAEGRSFAFETTLSGLTYARMIDRWRADGYVVKLIFLALASPEEAIARVAVRVRQGGHHVPDETIRRRFAAGLAHFRDVYRQRVDFWQLFDNSGESPLLVEEGNNL